MGVVNTQTAREQMAFRSPRMAYRRLTNGATWYSLLLTGHHMANHAKCANTSHGSHPTLGSAVRGLPRIIQERETSVLRGCLSDAEYGGPIDSSVSVGRRVLPVGEEA